MHSFPFVSLYYGNDTLPTLLAKPFNTEELQITLVHFKYLLGLFWQQCNNFNVYQLILGIFSQSWRSRDRNNGK